MKRWLVMLAACMLAAGGACDQGRAGPENSLPETGNKTLYSQADPAELTLLYPIQVGGVFATLLEDLIGQFQGETPGVTVDLLFPGDYDDTMEALATLAAAGDPPDLAILDTPKMLSLVSMELVERLDGFIAQDGGYDYINDFFPSFMQDCVYDGGIYGIPFQRSTLLMYYNKDHFREVGLDPERPPETWDQLADFARRLTKTDGAGKAERWGTVLPIGVYNFAPFVISNSADGENLMTRDGKKALFYSPENVEALQYLADLSAVHGAAPREPVEIGEAAEAFIDQTASIVQISSGNLANIDATVPFDYGVAMLPRSKRYASIAGGGNIHMIRGGTPERQQAAWQFIRWMTQPEKQAQWNVDTGYIAARKSAFDTTIMEAYYQEVPQARAAYDHLETCYSGFCVFEAPRLAALLEDYCGAALEGRMTAAEALTRAQTEADRILAPYQ